MQSPQNPRLWNLLVVLTIVMGAAVTLMILYPKPEAHATGEDPVAQVSENDSATQQTPHQDSILAEPSHQEQAIVQQSEDPATANYSVVAGSFLSQERAQRFEASIREKLSNAQPLVVPVRVDTITWYRVIVLRSSSAEDIDALKQSLQESGYGEPWVYERRKAR